jgi:hypothetical protein
MLSIENQCLSDDLETLEAGDFAFFVFQNQHIAPDLQRLDVQFRLAAGCWLRELEPAIQIESR